MNRRTLLKYAGTGIAAGVFSETMGKVMANSTTTTGKQPSIQSPGG